MTFEEKKEKTKKILEEALRFTKYPLLELWIGTKNRDEACFRRTYKKNYVPIAGVLHLNEIPSHKRGFVLKMSDFENLRGFIATQTFVVPSHRGGRGVWRREL